MSKLMSGRLDAGTKWVAPLLPALESTPASKRMVEGYGRERWKKDPVVAQALGLKRL